MNQSTFRSLLAGALLLALTASALAQPDKLNLDALNIGNEARTLNTANENITSFFADAAKLKKKESVSPSEFAALEHSADVAKRNADQIIAILIGIVRNLKAADHWNQQFDDQFVASVSRASVRSGLQQAGGARRLLEAAANETNNFAADIDQELESVRAKVATSKKEGLLLATSRKTDANHASSSVVVSNAAIAGHAPLSIGIKCKLLLVGLAIAEVAGADRTACRLDELYGEKGCGAKKPCAAATQ